MVETMDSFGLDGLCRVKRVRPPHAATPHHASHDIGQGVVSRPRALYSSCGALVLVEVAVVNGCFLVHGPRPLIEAPIEMALRLALSRGSGYGVVGAA
jgi:hypothetical protein